MEILLYFILQFLEEAIARQQGMKEDHHVSAFASFELASIYMRKPEVFISTYGTVLFLIEHEELISALNGEKKFNPKFVLMISYSHYLIQNNRLAEFSACVK